MIKNSIIFILIYFNSIPIFSQPDCRLISLDFFDLKNDSVCDEKFISVLKDRGLVSGRFANSNDFLGYLKNIDFYYFSFSANGDFDYIEDTYFFKIDSSTSIESLNQINTMFNDSNQNYFSLNDVGMVDSYDDYLIVYDKKHFNLYANRKSKNGINFELIGGMACSKLPERSSKCEFIFNKSKKEFLRKISDFKGYDNGLFHTYKIQEGKIIQIK